jgi:glutamyl-tRNA synthetase
VPPPPTTRLAPSPTGALHLGNARTFLANWALARRHAWRIVLRIEDLDTPRVKAGVIDQTIDLLSWLGIDWDEGPFVQSHDAPLHRDAMRRLVEGGHAYHTTTTRSRLVASGPGRAAPIEPSPQSAPQEGSHEARFPASLRPTTMPSHFDDAPGAWRFTTPDAPPLDTVRFADAFAGPQTHRPALTVGDFIVWTRRDASQPGQAAYQLAVVVDDHRQGVTHVVRGDDLLDSGARQLLLMRALGLSPEPTYCHLPLVKGQDGRRLAKRHGDTRLDHYRAKGVTRERVVGLVAWWCGMVPHRQPMDPREFRDRFTLDTMPKDAITFAPEDDAWLLARI